ncbi:MAG: hypothetical protein RLZZ568_2034, partial [Cyanobacteriota bacterium]
MTSPVIPPDQQPLQQLAHQAGYASLAALAQAAGVSDWQLARLERGLLPQIPVGVMMQLAIALRVPLDQLVRQLGASATLPPLPTEATPTASCRRQLDRLEKEYQRLQAQLATHTARLNAQFQEDVLNTLEPWLLQWPTAAAVAQQNPAFPAQKLLPLTRPITALLTQWQIETIAAVGAVVPFDPHWHEFMGEGVTPTEATPVVVRYVGYRRGETLLYR